MGMYGPQTDTFTRREYEELQLRIIELEETLTNQGIDIPGGPTKLRTMYLHRDPRKEKES